MSPLEANPSGPVVCPEAVVEEAERRLAELAEAVAARDNFIAVAAHELRNPMTPMIGQIELLLMGVKANKYSRPRLKTDLSAFTER